MKGTKTKTIGVSLRMPVTTWIRMKYLAKYYGSYTKTIIAAIESLWNIDKELLEIEEIAEEENDADR